MLEDARAVLTARSSKPGLAVTPHYGQNMVHSHQLLQCNNSSGFVQVCSSMGNPS